MQDGSQIMNKINKAFSWFFISSMLIISIIMGIIFMKFGSSSIYKDIDESNEYIEINGYNIINCYRNINKNRNKSFFTPQSLMHCAIDSISSSLNEREELLINSIYQSSKKSFYDVKYVTNNFKSTNLKELYLNGNIEIHSDDFEIHNPQLQKLYFNNLRTITGRLLATFSHNKLFYVSSDCSKYTNMEFNLTQNDFDYLYANVIYNIGNFWYGIDIDNDVFRPHQFYYDTDLFETERTYKIEWYTDKEYNCLYNESTIIQKKYKSNDNGDLIYVYQPLVLYGKINY